MVSLYFEDIVLHQEKKENMLNLFSLFYFVQINESFLRLPKSEKNVNSFVK